MRREKGGVVKDTKDTDNQGVSALLQIMDPNGKYLTSVILPEKSTGIYQLCHGKHGHGERTNSQWRRHW